MDDERLLVKRARHDKDAFLRLYHNYYPKLYAYLLVQARSRELAEDIAQETFLKALKAIKAYRFRGSSFGAWIFTIARNELTSHYRKNNRVHAAQDEELELHVSKNPSPHETVLEQEEDKATKEKYKGLLQAMTNLSKEDQELINMKYIAGFSYEAIEKVCKKRPNTLAVMLYRAIQKLRKALPQEDKSI